MTSSRDVFVTSHACYDHHRIPYKDAAIGQLGNLPHLGPGVTSVLSLTAGYSCMLGLRADVSHFWSLLPSSVFNLVVIIVSVCHMSTPLNTITFCECYFDYSTRRLHRTVLLSVGACEHHSGCTSLHLGSICHWGSTSSSHVAHITYTISCLLPVIFYIILCNNYTLLTPIHDNIIHLFSKYFLIICNILASI